MTRHVPALRRDETPSLREGEGHAAAPARVPAKDDDTIVSSCRKGWVGGEREKGWELTHCVMLLVPYLGRGRQGGARSSGWGPRKRTGAF